MADDGKYQASAAAPGVEALTKSLRESDERFRLLVESIKDYAIYLIDPDGHIASWNAGAERIKGYTADEIIGQHFSIFYPREVADHGWPMKELEIARRQGRFEEEGWRVRKDGTRFWADVVITPLFEENGELVGFAKITRDLTERYEASLAIQRANQELDSKNQQLEEKNRELQGFASVASHDLQEPLRKINTFSELLEQEYEGAVGENGRMYLERIRNAATRMSLLINDLLSFTRVNTQLPRFRPVDLNIVLDEVLSDLELSLTESGGRVDSDPLPTIEADPTQMRQLFQNLISNSIKFHKPDVPPAIRITDTSTAPSEDQPGACRIEVEDNGIGIEEKFLDQIFIPFQRLHTRREYPGTGIGLAICKQIVDRHGGSISARSVPGDGTIFTIELPLKQENPAEDE